MKGKENMMEKLFHIGFIEGIDSSHEIFSKQPCTAGNKITLLKRLWNCPHDKMGSVAVNALGGAIQHWEAIYAAEVGDVPQEDDDVPQVVRFRGNTFAQQMHQLGWIVIPARCWTVETLPKYTINKQQNYPPTTERTLPTFAHMFGYKSAQDVEENGKTLFHHLFTSLKYSGLSLEIAMKCFDPDEPRLIGDYTKAITLRKVTGTHPHGWTALHCLCNGSDPCMGTRDVILALLKHNVVTLKDFDSLTNDTGVTPLMLSCGSGIADCVKQFAQMNGDFSKVDDTGRGCLQRAKHAQGRKQILAHWLTHNVRIRAPCYPL